MISRSPVDPAQLVHHVAVEDDAQDRNQRHPGRPKRPGLAGIGLPQHHDRTHTITNASSVPMFTILPMSSIGVTLPTIAASSPDQDRVLPRCAKARMNRGEELLRQQAVVGHGVEHARLAQQHHQHHAGEAGQGAERDDVRCAGSPRSRNARAMGASMLTSRHGTMPVSTAATEIYRIVQASSETMMPMGKSRCGFLASCAVVETASNPI